MASDRAVVGGGTGFGGGDAAGRGVPAFGGHVGVQLIDREVVEHVLAGEDAGEVLARLGRDLLGREGEFVRHHLDLARSVRDRRPLVAVADVTSDEGRVGADGVTRGGSTWSTDT